jgi:hypothetical protein
VAPRFCRRETPASHPPYLGVELELVAASVFGFLVLWCFFWVAGFAADMSVAGAAAVAGFAGVAGVAAVAGAAAGAAVVAAEANIGAADNAAMAAATMI